MEQQHIYVHVSVNEGRRWVHRSLQLVEQRLAVHQILPKP